MGGPRVKKHGVLHAELSRQLALLGHTDRVVIGDSGLPLPRDLPVVDLALVPGMIPFQVVLDAVLGEIEVQAHVVAAEAFEQAVDTAGLWLGARADRMGTLTRVSHEEFKQQIAGAAFAIRTGEQTPYANVILECGVPF